MSMPLGCMRDREREWEICIHIHYRQTSTFNRTQFDHDVSQQITSVAWKIVVSHGDKYYTKWMEKNCQV